MYICVRLVVFGSLYPSQHSPLSTVVSRLSSELLGYEGMLPPTPEGLAAGVSDYDLKKHVDDLVDHVAALKEQTASMVRACVRKGVVSGIGLVCMCMCMCMCVCVWTDPNPNRTDPVPINTDRLGQVAERRVPQQ